MLGDSKEREHAYRGLVKTLGCPGCQDAARESFAFICACISQYKRPPQDLEQQFGQVVIFYAQKVQ